MFKLTFAFTVASRFRVGEYFENVTSEWHGLELSVSSRG